MAVNRCHASLMVALLALSNPGCAPVVRKPSTPRAATPVNDNPSAVPAPHDEMPKVMQIGQSQSLIQLSLDDAARRSQRDASTLEVVSAEPVTWTDGSIGCPQPGRQYTQALVPGFRIRIRAGTEIL